MEQRNYILKTFLYMLDHKESPVVSVFWALQCDTSTKFLQVFYCFSPWHQLLSVLGLLLNPSGKRKLHLRMN